MSNEEIAQLETDLQKAKDIIDAAYWRFTRCARAKPPILVCPEAYARRSEIENRLRDLRKEKP